MKKKPEKQKDLDALREELKKASNVFLTGYEKLTVGQDFELRKTVRGAGANYKVIKNRIAEKAAEGTASADLLKDLKGMCSLAYTSGDPVALAKALTAYAKCKLLVERDVAALADPHFSPVFLRNATAFGASPRMRFDIVLNNLAGFAWTTNEIKMTSDGTPWRPLVHVADICEAIVSVLAAPQQQIHNEVFNVGDDTQNYRVREIAEVVGKIFEGAEVSFGQQGGDNRSYRISFQKIRRHLPDFQCRWTVERGAHELQEIFRRVRMTKETFLFRAFTRLEQLKHLLVTGQIDDSFYWREPPK